MFSVVKDGEGVRKLSFFEDRENDVVRRTESFIRKCPKCAW